MVGTYLTQKEINTLEMLKKCRSQKEVAKKLKVTESNVSLTINRAKEKIIKSQETFEFAKRKGYIELLQLV